MQKNIQIYTITLAVFFTAILFYSFSKDSKLPAKSRYSVSAVPPIAQVVESIPMRDNYDFAGEQLPLDNFDVRERLERELTVNTYWHSSTVLNLKRTARFFPTIEKILKEEGVPDDFKYLAVAESNLENVTSPAGAAGLWQFLKGAGKEYGLEINKEVDERYHLEKATHAAAKYLKKLKARFGNWTMAAAAYNAGASRISNAVDNQKTGNYYDLNLNIETGRYIFRIVALKEVITQPLQFGYQIDKEDYYPPLDDFAIVTVNKEIKNLGDFAKKYGMTYRMLKVYNPWLRTDKLTNKQHKTYYIKVKK